MSIDKSGTWPERRPRPARPERGAQPGGIGKLGTVKIATAACAAIGMSAVLASPVAAQQPLTPADTGMDPSAWTSTRDADELNLELIAAEPIEVGQAFSVTLRATNPTDETVNNLEVTARRGDAASTTRAARAELAMGDYPYYGPVTDIGTLAPGQSREFTFEVATTLEETSTLAITQPGVYPLLFTLNGTRDGQPASFADERLLLDVTAPPATAAGPTKGSAPAEPAAPADTPGAEPGAEPAAPAPPAPPAPKPSLSLLYPVTARTNILPGETGGEDLILSNEELADQLAENGRLDRLVDTYLSHDLNGATCMVLDPALVDTVERMTAGYTVGDNRPSIAKKPQRLRDSWFRQDDSDRGEPGSGSADAQRWIDKLRQVDCIMAMPWANTDPSAVAATENGWLLFEAVERGKDTLERVLNHPVDNLAVVPASGYIDYATSVPMVVADNTTVAGDGGAIPFDASLGALLAQTGDQPQTAGYSNPALRYDFSLDSTRARALSAAAGLSLALESAEGDQVTAKLPNYLDPDTAGEVLDTAADLAGTYTPRPVSELAPRALSGTDAPADAPVEPGSPFPDPAAFATTDILPVRQQARYTDELTFLMVNDPAIAMTRYGFTLPLRRDLLTALTVTGRGSQQTYGDSVGMMRARLERHSTVLRDLRESVALIPPGNVYTRVSESSPLLIVAENGLPLPVSSTLAYQGPDGARLNAPAEIRIPAKGSITLSLTATLPTNADRTDLRLWLATQSGQTISQPINIAVQTRAGIVSVYGLALAAALILILAIVFKAGRKKKSSRRD